MSYRITRHVAEWHRPDDQLIGELVWTPSSGGTFEFHLDVVPEYQRKGVGRSMVEEMETLARSQKGMALYSFCASDNDGAVAFFRAMGFNTFFATDFYGEGRHSYFLWKPIGRPE